MPKRILRAISDLVVDSELPFVSDMMLEDRINKEVDGNFELLPRQLAIETVNYCNAECIMCPSRSMKRQKGIMSMEVHRTIVDAVAKTCAPISLITHAGIGEPLIDKQLADKILYEKKAFNEAKVGIYTNASLLDGNRASELISSGIDQVTISLNAFRKETYEAVMKLPYEKTIQNVQHFLAKNDEAGSPIWVQVSLVPTDICSSSEIKEFSKYWSEKVDSIAIPPWINWGIFGSRTEKKQWPCRYIWEVLLFDWDGTVKMCCEDYDSNYPAGNIKNESPLKIFNSERMIRQRKAQLENKFEWPAICRDCIETLDVARGFWKCARLAKACISSFEQK